MVKFRALERHWIAFFGARALIIVEVYDVVSRVDIRKMCRVVSLVYKV